MSAIEPIPLAEPDDGPNPARLGDPTRTLVKSRSASKKVWPTARSKGPGVWALLMLSLCVSHGLAIWKGVGGQQGLESEWPLWRDDHPLYYHSALVTRAFLGQSGTTAGYDPSFMAGYAKSVIFPASSTLPELVVTFLGGDRPARAYKWYVVVSAAVIPWLVVMAAGLWGLSARGTTLAVLLYLLYVWCDFPINYAEFGMLPYLAGIPLALVATGVFSRFLERGGFVRWFLASALCSLAVLVHLTTAMIVVPAALASYLGRIFGSGTPPSTAWSPGDPPPEAGRGRTSDHRALSWAGHLGVWLIPALVLLENVFWWFPGLWLASTKGKSDFAFAHPEGVIRRLVQIAASEAPIESILIGAGLVGMAVLAHRGRVGALALGGFAAAGFAWGYLAGEVRSLDFLQPGRHTYAFYTALAVAGGAGLDAMLLRLRLFEGSLPRLDGWATLAASLVAARMIVLPTLVPVLQARLFGPEPFLTSRPPQKLLWVIDRVKSHVKPGERLLYEEGGFSLPGLPDPYHRGRFSGLIPEKTGVEVIGGPYLHASLNTNFTQFGEGKLCGKADWGREEFVRYAKLYGPSAILCWTPHARQFCRSNPDLVTVEEEEGTLLIGRIRGFDGDAIVGSARVEAAPGRLRVTDMMPGVDGTIVLRYHSVPSLRANPPVPLDSQYEADDPVPFIRLRPPPGGTAVDLELVIPSELPKSRPGPGSGP